MQSQNWCFQCIYQLDAFYLITSHGVFSNINIEFAKEIPPLTKESRNIKLRNPNQFKALLIGWEFEENKWRNCYEREWNKIVIFWSYVSHWFTCLVEQRPQWTLRINGWIKVILWR